MISALLFFLSILLHELGHAWVAIRNGIPIEGIDLWMFGGVAKLGKDADSPGVEFRVAAAGPLVTMRDRAPLLRRLARRVSSGSDALHSAQFDQNVTGATTAVLGYLVSINLLLLAFNLIPAFPLDGGRIARAIAWKLTGDRNRATRFAARLGRTGRLPDDRRRSGALFAARATTSAASGSRSSAGSWRARRARPKRRRTSRAGSNTFGWLT